MHWVQLNKSDFFPFTASPVIMSIDHYRVLKMVWTGLTSRMHQRHVPNAPNEPFRPARDQITDCHSLPNTLVFFFVFPSTIILLSCFGIWLFCSHIKITAITYFSRALFIHANLVLIWIHFVSCPLLRRICVHTKPKKINIKRLNFQRSHIRSC